MSAHTTPRLAGFALILVLALLALAEPAAAAGRRYVLPGDAVFPEGIAYQASGGYFYVSSTTDGTIFRGQVNNDTAEVFLPGGSDGRTTATGMKVDSAGRLFISGGGSGQMFVYDTASKGLLGSFKTSRTPTFINDVAVTPDGSAYFTDSNQPVLYRVYPSGNTWAMEEWIDFTGTALVYQQGFNLNGIAASADGAYLIVVQSNTGKLFRIATATKAVSEINIGAETVASGDGIFLRDHTLWVSRNSLALIVTIDLTADYSSGRVVSAWTDTNFAYPTTIAVNGNTLWAVNSQFDKRGNGNTPVLPFTVAAVDLPGTSGGAAPGMPVTGAGDGSAIFLLAFGLALVALVAGFRLRRRA